MSSTVEQIKARLSIVDVISTYVKIEKAGVNFKACCPFHNEKTPSFFISPARDNFHCFGCGKGGDILSFTQEIEGVDFIGALKILAEKAGVEIAKTDNTNRGEKEALLAVLRDATDFYRVTLKNNKEVLAYLASRGLTPESIEQFEIGFAPDGWRVGHEFLQKRGHRDEAIEKAGLGIRAQAGSLYDRFRARVMFPLKDHLGNVVGFSGRVLPGGDEPTNGVAQAKYINSPQTLLYDKSHMLYGIDRAKMAIRKADVTVLVEGQMDLVLSHQAQVEHAVAVSGTALTEDHLKQLSRLSNNLVMAFDADNAGVAASVRAINLGLGLGMQIKIALLPDTLDPADLVRNDPLAWQESVKNAQHVIDFFLEVYNRKTIAPDEQRRSIETNVIPYIGLLRSSLDQGHYVAKIAQRLGLSESSVWEAVRRAPQKAPSPVPVSVLPEKPKMQRKNERIIFILFGIVLWQRAKKEPGIDPELLESKLAELLGQEEWGAMKETLESKKEEALISAEVSYADSTKLSDTVDELMLNLEEDLLGEQFGVIMSKLRNAELEKDTASLEKYLASCHEITAKLSALKRKRYEKK